jgi:hypothetical protein
MEEMQLVETVEIERRECRLKEGMEENAGNGGEANDNKVTISETGKITGYSDITISAGYAIGGTGGSGSSSGNPGANEANGTGGTANDNTVEIAGEISSPKRIILCGGMVGLDGTATGNKVILKETVKISTTTELYGGMSTDLRTIHDNILRGNILEIYAKTASLQVNKIDNFAEYRFELLKGIVAGDSVLKFNSDSNNTALDLAGKSIKITLDLKIA